MTAVLTDEEYRLLQSTLAARPDAGKVIPGLHGLRKFRWSRPSTGTGKRSGLRILYLYVPSAHLIYLLLLYSKKDLEELTPAQRKQVGALVAAIKQEYSA